MRKFMSFMVFATLALVGSLRGQGEAVESINPLFQQEIKELTSRPAIQKAFAQILEEDNQTIEDLIHLTEIAAPPFEENERAEEFKTMLMQAGLKNVWIDEVGNVLALRKGLEGKRLVALDAHLDTVFPKETDVSVKTNGDTLLAPGIGDDTRGLAMVLAVVRALEDSEIATKADLLIVGSVGEEGLGDLRGVKHLFKGDLQIDSWISIDGGDIGRVNNKALGSYRYRVTFMGPGGHSWGSFGLANPHHALGSAIEYFVQSADEFTTEGPKTSYNIGRIGGGTSINSIPFSSWMEIDIRSIKPARLDIMEDLLKNAISRAVKEQNDRRRLGKELTVNIEKIGERPSGELPEDLPIIQRAIAATAYFGKRARLSRGSTNSNIPISLGVPAVTIGRGGQGGNGHALDEWWINDEGHKSIQLALLLVIAEAGMSD